MCDGTPLHRVWNVAAWACHGQLSGNRNLRQEDYSVPIGIMVLPGDIIVTLSLEACLSTEWSRIIQLMCICVRELGADDFIVRGLLVGQLRLNLKGLCARVKLSVETHLLMNHTQGHDKDVEGRPPERMRLEELVPCQGGRQVHDPGRDDAHDAGTSPCQHGSLREPSGQPSECVGQPPECQHMWGGRCLQ